MYPHLIHLHGPWEVVGSDHQRISTLTLPATLSLPTGGELRRSFQWVSPPRAGERIFLTFERLVGSPRLLLNGEELPVTIHPWLPIRVDVAGRLQPRNQLALLYADASSLAGAQESIHLSIESELARNVQIEWDWSEPTEEPSFRAQMTFESSGLGGSAGAADLLVELNNKRILRRSILLEEGLNRVDFEHGPMDVDPWRPSTVGLPIRQDMRVVLRVADQILWQRSMQVGFRRVDADRGDNRSVIVAGKHDFPLNEELVPTAIDLWGSGGMDWLTQANGRVDLVGELAGHHFYDGADRRGLLVCHHALGDADLERAVRGRSEHPCVVLLPNRKY